MTFDEWCRHVGYDGMSNGWADIAFEAGVRAERQRCAMVVRNHKIEYGVSPLLNREQLAVEIERAVESETETTRREVPPGAGGETPEVSS